MNVCLFNQNYYLYNRNRQPDVIMRLVQGNQVKDLSCSCSCNPQNEVCIYKCHCCQCNGKALQTEGSQNTYLFQAKIDKASQERGDECRFF